MKNINKYQNEVHDKYSNTNEYKDFINNHNNNYDAKTKLLMEIFIEIGNKKNLSIESNEIQSLVKKLQNFITNNFYTCSLDMLKNLGQLYVQDNRFKDNINKIAGCGTSEYVNEAIKYYYNKGGLYEN